MKNDRKDRLVETLGGKCQACGATDALLNIHHIIPQSLGIQDDERNLILLCSNCHRAMSTYRFTEMEFTEYLINIMRLSGDFQEILAESIVSSASRLRADIIAKSHDEKWLIECKNASSFTPMRFEKTLEQMKRYRNDTSFDHYVLAFPGLLSEEQKIKLSSNQIIAWDADNLSSRFKSEINQSKHPIFQIVFSSRTSSQTEKSTEHLFIEKLKLCKPGKTFWSDYQKLVGQILEHLFCPPLEVPISESADQDKINRRDWILPNYADQGFWSFLRTKYLADYVVVDAKNYKQPISKNQILQIANYLKTHGAGMFAMIVTRSGANKSAALTMREQWMANKKMILVLNDEDLEAMLLAKSAGGEPETIIGQAIERFRLSM